MGQVKQVAITDHACYASTRSLQLAKASEHGSDGCAVAEGDEQRRSGLFGALRFVSRGMRYWRFGSRGT